MYVEYESKSILYTNDHQETLLDCGYNMGVKYTYKVFHMEQSKPNYHLFIIGGL